MGEKDQKASIWDFIGADVSAVLLPGGWIEVGPWKDDPDGLSSFDVAGDSFNFNVAGTADSITGPISSVLAVRYHDRD